MTKGKSNARARGADGAAVPAAKAGPQPPAPAPAAAPRQQTLKFRTDNLKSSYCNMANVTSTREEVVMNFGVNQNWDQPGGTPGALEVDIQHRVILSPFAAKRLSDALVQLVRDYEQRYGPLA